MINVFSRFFLIRSIIFFLFWYNLISFKINYAALLWFVFNCSFSRARVQGRNRSTTTTRPQPHKIKQEIRKIVTLVLWILTAQDSSSQEDSRRACEGPRRGREPDSTGQLGCQDPPPPQPLWPCLGMEQMMSVGMSGRMSVRMSVKMSVRMSSHRGNYLTSQNCADDINALYHCSLAVHF